MRRMSYEDIGAVVATCQATSAVQGGDVVKITGHMTAGKCADGEPFCGVASQPREGICGVQFKGFMTVNYTGTLFYGWKPLVSNGQGGVRVAGSAEDSIHVQVVGIHTDGTAVICM